MQRCVSTGRRGAVLIALSVLLALLLSGTALAQTTTAPYYFTTIDETRTVDNGARLEFVFTVSNLGAPMPQQVPAYLVLLTDDSPRQLSSLDVAQLGTNQQARGTLSTAVLGLPSGPLTFYIQLVPPVGAAGTFLRSDPVVIELDGDVINLPPASTVASPLALLDLTSRFNIDLNDPQQRGLFIIVFILIVLILWLLITLARLLLRRPPEFGNWQPPYATMPHIDPYSTAGMRQGWQQYAQSNVLTQPPTTGAAQPIKLLTGNDGVYLSAWEITALRLSLYDQYGRVTQSQTLAPKTLVKTLNRMAQRRERLKPARARRPLERLSRQLVKRFVKRVNKRNALLPIALDVRFRARHGEVAIVFELYQGHNNQWVRVDRWQPDMVVVSRTIYESYTYSLYGQTGGETLKEYRKRLVSDVARWLEVLLQIPEPEAAAPKPARPASPAVPTPEYAQFARPDAPASIPAESDTSTGRKARNAAPASEQAKKDGAKSARTPTPATQRNLAPVSPSGIGADVDDDEEADNGASSEKRPPTPSSASRGVPRPPISDNGDSGA
jgi:hypothetical protein